MSALGHKLAKGWTRVGPGLLPFADAASDALPLGRLLRLSLFQVSVGMAVVLITGTLNRVMIVELGVPAWLVSVMIALPLVFAPLRALIGFRSDTYTSHLGWRRVPFIWFGTLLQFGGLAIMPFALILLSGDTNAPGWVGQAGAALAFLLVGAGLHTTQTAGLALATDLAPSETRPRVVALLFVTLLLGMALSALAFGWLLADFSQLRLIRVIQGAAMVTLGLNLLALWKQEALDPERTAPRKEKPRFMDAWRALLAEERSGRLLLAVGLGTAAFTMQDVLLEPFGGEILGLSVSATTVLTALFAGGTLVAFMASARFLSRGMDPHRLAGYGAVVGIAAFGLVTLVAAVQSVLAFRIGVVLIGFGGGLFAVGGLTAAMNLARRSGSGLALGAWGAVQATATGLGIALGGVLRDGVSALATSGALGPALTGPSTGYGVVYQVEVVLLFITLIVIGPLARHAARDDEVANPRLGLAEFPGA
jgi:BCD family chlorophyll transporter-like MFS transporter